MPEKSKFEEILLNLDQEEDDDIASEDREQTINQDYLTEIIDESV